MIEPSCSHDTIRDNPDGSQTCIRCGDHARYGYTHQAEPIDLTPTNQAKADAALDAAKAAWLADTDDDNPDPDAALNALAPALIAIGHQLAALNEQLTALTTPPRVGGDPERD